VEFIEVFFRQRFEAVEDRGFIHWLEGMVAFQAAMEGMEFVGQVETPDDFCQLFERLERAQAVAVLDDFSHQEAAVAGQQDARLSLENTCQI